ENSLYIRLSHSMKGYTDGEIGVEWIKQFDKQTHAKAAGRRRLLLVDGHNSHYTHAFLKYAHKNQIVILCYPSHSTHIYQGLDVVIFSVLKRWWTEARDKYEQQWGHKVDKTNFLSVYAEAHLQALSKENIIAAFRKTGIILLNRDVITDEMLAPSTTSSSRGFLPIPQTSP
ncbi:DDE-domain-containing protein, partial [Tricholoma matsutake]